MREHIIIIIQIPYTGKFSRGNIFVDFVVSIYKTRIFTHELDIRHGMEALNYAEVMKFALHELCPLLQFKTTKTH